jgi:hypothetical protein
MTVEEPGTGEQPQARWFAPALVAAALAVFGWYTFVSWTQFAAHRLYLADLGSFHAIVAGPLHGVWLQTPVAWRIEGANYWGIHFQPALFLLTPLFLVRDHPLVLVGAFNVALAGAGVVLGLWARRALSSAWLGLAFAAAWWLNHFVLTLHLSVHPESLAMPAWFGLFWAVEARRRGPAAACALLVLAIKEDMAVYLALCGVALALDRDTRRWGGALVAAGAGWWVLATAVMHACGHAAMVEAGATAMNRYASLGDSPGGIVLAALGRPLEMLGRFLTPSLAVLYLSLGGLSLLDRRAFWLPAAAVAPILLCDDDYLRNLPVYYAYPALPFLFWTALRGSRWLSSLESARARLALRVVGGLLAATALAGISLPTRLDDTGARHRPYEVLERNASLAVVLADLPPDAPTAVQYELHPQVPLRPVLLPLREKHLPDVEYLVLDLRRYPADFGGRREAFDALITAVDRAGFRTVSEIEGFALLRRAPAAGADGP